MNITDFQVSLLKLIKTGEGTIAHMYLDTVGKVTVGVGNMLPNAAAAQLLGFLQRGDDTAATRDQINNEFAFILRQKMGRPAGSYEQYTKLYLPEDAIDRLLAARIVTFESGVRADFPQYESFPPAAKLALMDMVFNLGNRGLVTKFPSLARAAKNQDWAECAAQCQRKGISEQRNAEVRELFLSVQKV